VGKRLVISEKPSVAHDIAAALGGFVEGKDDYLESEDYVVTWALGHLLELCEPQDYDKQLKSWSVKLLPIIPDAFEVKPRDGQKKRLDMIKRLGKRKDVEGVINACDAGREGEMIFRRIADHVGLNNKPQERLWLQSMTHESIRKAFANLRPGSELDNLSEAAKLRAIGDWLIGMNATRALTQRLKSKGERGAWSAGRVQTPTLWMLVEREMKILAHVPRQYWEMEAEFSVSGVNAQGWTAKYHDTSNKKTEEEPERRPGRLFDATEVARILEGVKAAGMGKAAETRKKSKQKPPLMFDLTSLQREANRRFSLSAKRALDAAQRLYERHKATTYPRTDSRYLPDDYEATVRGTLDKLAVGGELTAVAQKIVAAGPENLPKILNSAKVTDHFAIVPTGTIPVDLTGDDAKVYDLIVRQFLASLMGPATWANVERIVDVDIGADKPAKFRSTARSLEIPGFLEALGQEAGSGTQMPHLVPGDDKSDGVESTLSAIAEVEKETRPPSRFNEAQLLRMMETAGEDIDEADLSEAMRGRGLGTPATRADTIERLVATAYARRVEGRLAPSSKAMRLMDVLGRVNAFGLTSPKLTGEWQHLLNLIEVGDRKPSAVRDAIVKYTRGVTESLVGFEHDTLYDGEPSLGICPGCGGQVRESAWGYSCEHNVTRESECNFIIWKDRAGKFIDRKLASKLIIERKIGPVDGFVDRAGRRYLSGTVSLEKDPDTGRWILLTEFGASEDDVDEETRGVLGPCLDHEDCEIIETNVRYVCKKVLAGETRKGPVLPLKVCQREMSLAEAMTFFGEGAKTEILEGFISKRGRPFRGALFRKPTGKHGFEFPPREPKKGKAGAKKTTAKKGKAAAKKTPAKKTPAKKTPAKKTTAKKSTAKKTPAKKSTAKKTTAKKSAAKTAASETSTSSGAAKKRSTSTKKKSTPPAS
jgi:DNA topoisomerase III